MVGVSQEDNLNIKILGKSFWKMNEAFKYFCKNDLYFHAVKFKCKMRNMVECYNLVGKIPSQTPIKINTFIHCLF